MAKIIHKPNPNEDRELNYSHYSREYHPDGGSIESFHRNIHSN